MELKDLPLHELSAKVKAGGDKAIRLLVEDRAAKGMTMVVGDYEGNYGIVPAAELLRAVNDGVKPNVKELLVKYKEDHS